MTTSNSDPYERWDGINPAFIYHGVPLEISRILTETDREDIFPRGSSAYAPWLRALFDGAILSWLRQAGDAGVQASWQTTATVQGIQLDERGQPVLAIASSTADLLLAALRVGFVVGFAASKHDLSVTIPKDEL